MIMPKNDPGIIFNVKVIKPCGESHLSKHSKKESVINTQSLHQWTWQAKPLLISNFNSSTCSWDIKNFKIHTILPNLYGDKRYISWSIERLWKKIDKIKAENSPCNWKASSCLHTIILSNIKRPLKLFSKYNVSFTIYESRYLNSFKTHNHAYKKLKKSNQSRH